MIGIWYTAQASRLRQLGGIVYTINYENHTKGFVR